MEGFFQGLDLLNQTTHYMTALLKDIKSYFMLTFNKYCTMSWQNMQQNYSKLQHAKPKHEESCREASCLLENLKPK